MYIYIYIYIHWPPESMHSPYVITSLPLGRYLPEGRNPSRALWSKSAPWNPANRGASEASRSTNKGRRVAA